jgi:hypothetical protein
VTGASATTTPNALTLGGPFGNLTVWELPLPEGLGGAGGETRFVTLSDLDCGDCDSGDWLVIDWSEIWTRARKAEGETSMGRLDSRLEGWVSTPNAAPNANYPPCGRFSTGAS